MTKNSLSIKNAKRECRHAIDRIVPYSNDFKGRGIVLCAGGSRYFPNAWVCINMLRHHGCRLPIQVWYRGFEEYDERMPLATKALGVTLVDAVQLRQKDGGRSLGGWELKPFAIIHCPFQEVIYIDADNVPLVDPEFLLETPEFKKTGAVFWPDFGHLQPDDPIWSICGISFRDEPEFESGQIVVDKKKVWKELQLAMWFNEHSDFFYRFVLGDKETFHLAFMLLGTPYSMPSTSVQAIHCTMCQHDFGGRRIFQHRNMDKWVLDGANKVIDGFLHEDLCRGFLKSLKELWQRYDRQGVRISLGAQTERVINARRVLVNNLHVYNRQGYDQRLMAFSSSGKIDVGAALQEQSWHLGEKANVLELTIFSDDGVTCVLKQQKDGVWRGRWRVFERMPVELRLEKFVNENTNGLAGRGSGLNAKARKRMIFRTPLNAYTGYGLHACEIASFLLKQDIELALRPTDLNELFAPIPLELRKRICAREIDSEWELLLHPPGREPLTGRKTVYSTMWESSRLREDYVNNLNRAECVIVPSSWNAACFSASGVNCPLWVVPLGIHADIFRFQPMIMDGPCVFGAAGRLESGGMRKGLNDVIAIFQKAFPNETDVRLYVKAFPDCAITRVADSRIRIVQEYYSAQQLARWFAGLTCFVSASRGEGWGLMQHQALAVGRPLINVKFGGVNEFFTSDMGYPVEYKLVRGVGLYKDGGVWADPDHDSIIEAMRHVYRDRSDARKKGEFASPRVSALSWSASNQSLLKVLKQVGILG